MLDGRQLGECAFRPQIRHRQRALQCQAFAHHFAEQARGGLVRQRPLVQRLDAAQYLCFALRTVHHARAFEFADGLCVRRPLVEQGKDLPVNFINGGAVREKLGIIRHGKVRCKNKAVIVAKMTEQKKQATDWLPEISQIRDFTLHKQLGFRLTLPHRRKE